MKYVVYFSRIVVVASVGLWLLAPYVVKVTGALGNGEVFAFALIWAVFLLPVLLAIAVWYVIEVVAERKNKVREVA